MKNDGQEMGWAPVTEEGESVAVQQVGDYGALTAVSRAEVDMQVTTAKQYPRSIARFQKEAYQLATLDRETAQSMYYSLPRKDKNGKRTFIEGPSVRFAEVVAYSWGNLRFEGRIIDIGKQFVTAQGTAWDLERNLGSRIEVQRRITNANGVRYNDDMIAVTGNAAVSIALRNAIFDVIPFALAKKVYDAALKTAMGEHEPMEQRRERALSWFKQAGAEESEVYAMLGIQGAADITSDHIRHLIGLQNAIIGGETTLEAALRESKNGHASEGTSELNEAVKASAPATAATPPKFEKPKASASSIKKLRELRETLLAKDPDALLYDDMQGIEAAIIEKDGEHVAKWIESLTERLATADGRLV